MQASQRSCYNYQDSSDESQYVCFEQWIMADSEGVVNQCSLTIKKESEPNWLSDESEQQSICSITVETDDADGTRTSYSFGPSCESVKFDVSTDISIEQSSFKLSAQYLQQFSSEALAGSALDKSKTEMESVPAFAMYSGYEGDKFTQLTGTSMSELAVKDDDSGAIKLSTVLCLALASASLILF